MVVFNYSTRELTTKVVYYGPGLCGKTTNLQFIYDHMPQGVRGKMLSLATKSDRTLFFDFLPIDLGTIQGMKTKVQLYTVPGQVFYNETRRLVLKGADGVVFVADSQENMIEANLDSLRNLEENLQAHGMSMADTPHVLQFNKQDLPNALPVDVLNEKLNKYNAPFYEAIATTGVGVQETLRHITKLVLLKLNDKYGKEKGSGVSRAATTVAAPSPAPPSAPPAIATPASTAPRSTVTEVSSMPTLVSPVASMPHVEVAAPQAAPRLAAVAAPLPTPTPPKIAATVLPSTAAAPFGTNSADEDVLGIGFEAPRRSSGSMGATVKLDRGAVSVLERTETDRSHAHASATAVAVDETDPLFNEDGVEPTVLRPGDPQEILVPLELRTALGIQRFRLTIRLEVSR
jgi:signal recognition particle receptor subunit beta